YHSGLQSSSTHALFVDAAGATPDGRVFHDLLADGGVSAAQGRDKNGPTALINSVAKLDHYSATNGTLLNIKFHPSAVAGEAGCNNLLALLRTFFDKGGHHVQFNCTDSRTLRDAQLNPEKYPSLVVRVAGFSVLFTSIDKTLQDDIINRTEQTMA
ncbi:MAG: glycyl radical protein, partial [Spirochaetaceae bacterium]|nr:glycyl radical protein [Spirochaetaceae bacterium]